MPSLDFLHLLARSLLRHTGNALGFGIAGDVLVSVADDVWREWAARPEPQRRSELDAVLRSVPPEVDATIVAIVQEVAADRSPQVQAALADCLRSVPERLRASLSPGVQLQSATDLVKLLSAPNLPRATASEHVPVGPSVTLIATKGIHSGKAFAFTERSVITLGRSHACTHRLPDDNTHQYTSRHHCLLDIAPPRIRIRDLGSKSGTFVNGDKLGRNPEDVPSSERELQHGDAFHLTKGAIVAYRVEIVNPPVRVRHPQKMSWPRREQYNISRPE